jgi:beta-glucosidase
MSQESPVGSESAAGSLAFPPGFIWGAATAAYQIEGGARADGRGQSIWDTFSRTPGKVHGGDTGDIACDSYHRYGEDVELMSSLGLRAYRFSISWPRVQPGGTGPLNTKGVDYYKALLDRLAEHGIAPTATLYHWDLPQELQDAGGWPVRDTAARFADYAEAMGQALGDRVAQWITLNEPHIVSNHGYLVGNHAPGLRDAYASAATTHHLLLAHGLALSALRATVPDASIGITLDLHPVKVLGDGSDEALEHARQVLDADSNGLYLEPLLNGRYPTHASASVLPDEALIADDDLTTISQPFDFLGVNYYAGTYIRPGDPEDLRRNEVATDAKLPAVVGYQPPWLERTAMGWLIDADGLYELLMRLSKDAPGLPLYITENGCAAEDYVNPDGVVHDEERVRYLQQHLAASARAVSDGANLAGYFVWSLLDNFEWGCGYQKRFGIIFVDFGSQRRIPKSSAHFYSSVIRANAVPLSAPS